MTCACAVLAFGADEDSAASAVAQAESDMASGFDVVLEAERVGADVSVLLVRLNGAGESLAEAEVAYKRGDFNESVRLAGICSVTSEEVKSEAEELWVQAYGQKSLNLGLRAAGSLVGMVTVGVGSVWAWRVFKRRYYRGVLKMKPEVDSNGS